MLKNLNRYAFESFCTNKQHVLTLIRHGQSIWNKQKKWAGWTDVPLSAFGIQQARNCAKLLRQSNMSYDLVYTSRLRRSITTAHFILDQLNMLYLPVHKQWRLNQKHYGQLQGCSKVQTNQKYGSQKVNEWRRSLTVRPPPISIQHQSHPINNKVYKDVDPNILPNGENLNDVLNRVRKLWQQKIVNDLKNNKSLLIIAHGSSIRALLRIIRPELSQEQIRNFNIPNATPVLLTLDNNLKFKKQQILGNPQQIKRKMNKVKNETQGQKN